MRKHKTAMAAALLILTVSLMSGVSYAWFADRAVTDQVEMEAGYLQIDLAGSPGATMTMYPGMEPYKIDYTLTNTSGIPVYAKFVPGDLTMYLVPEKYIDNEGFIIKGSREELLKMTDKEKKEYFEPTSVIDKGKVIYGTGSGEKGGWTISGGSEYLETDKDGTAYFRLAVGGSAGCSFRIGLTSAADNRYQYALFTLGEAAAFATQDNEAAIKILRGDD